MTETLCAASVWRYNREAVGNWEQVTCGQPREANDHHYDGDGPSFHTFVAPPTDDGAEPLTCPECGGRLTIVDREMVMCRDESARQGCTRYAVPVRRSALPSDSEASPPTTHELKVWTMYADALESGVKTFEFRKDDRTPRFEVGDTLVLREWTPPYRAETEHEWSKQFGGDFTGREWLRRVSYVARGGVIPDGYCVMSVVPLPMSSGATPPPAPTARFVCGFAIYGRGDIVLIEKKRPAWQCGKWNGVGGRIEAGESDAAAMRREFREETGADVETWEHFATLATDHGTEVVFFRALLDERPALQMVTDENPSWWFIDSLPETIPNLRWLIPMALRESTSTGMPFKLSERDAPDEFTELRTQLSTLQAQQEETTRQLTQLRWSAKMIVVAMDSAGRLLPSDSPFIALRSALPSGGTE